MEIDHIQHAATECRHMNASAAWIWLLQHFRSTLPDKEAHQARGAAWRLRKQLLRQPAVEDTEPCPQDDATEVPEPASTDCQPDVPAGAVAASEPVPEAVADLPDPAPDEPPPEDPPKRTGALGFFRQPGDQRYSGLQSVFINGF